MRVLDQKLNRNISKIKKLIGRYKKMSCKLITQYKDTHIFKVNGSTDISRFVDGAVKHINIDKIQSDIIAIDIMHRNNEDIIGHNTVIYMNTDELKYLADKIAKYFMEVQSNE